MHGSKGTKIRIQCSSKASVWIPAQVLAHLLGKGRQIGATWRSVEEKVVSMLQSLTRKETSQTRKYMQ